MLLLLQTVFSNNFEFVPGTTEDYFHKLNKHLYYGQIDKYGNFVQYSNPSGSQVPEYIGNVFPKSFTKHYEFFVSSGGSLATVYEYRSGRLIPGIVERFNFVPDIGGKVIPLSEYHFPWSPGRIYNLPGKFVLTINKHRATKESVTPTTRTDGVKEKSVPNPGKDRPPSTDYEFKLTPTVAYSRQFGNMLYYGTLDEFGNFVPSPTVRGMDVTKAMPKDADKYIPLMSHIKQKHVYEFRSWTLIPGIIENGEFLPDLDNKIIDFADYRYSKEAKPIYNLPGKFFPVGKEK